MADGGAGSHGDLVPITVEQEQSVGQEYVITLTEFIRVNHVPV